VVWSGVVRKAMGCEKQLTLTRFTSVGI